MYLIRATTQGDEVLTTLQLDVAATEGPRGRCGSGPCSVDSRLLPNYLRVVGKCAPCWWRVCRLRAVLVHSGWVDLVQVGRPDQEEDELLAYGWH